MRGALSHWVSRESVPVLRHRRQRAFWTPWARSYSRERRDAEAADFWWRSSYRIGPHHGRKALFAVPLRPQSPRTSSKPTNTAPAAFYVFGAFRPYSRTFAVLYGNRGERLENQQTREISAACGPFCGPHTASIPGFTPVETLRMPSRTHGCSPPHAGCSRPALFGHRQTAAVI